MPIQVYFYLFRQYRNWEVFLHCSRYTAKMAFVEREFLWIYFMVDQRSQKLIYQNHLSVNMIMDFFIGQYWCILQTLIPLILIIHLSYTKLYRQHTSTYVNIFSPKCPWQRLTTCTKHKDTNIWINIFSCLLPSISTSTVHILWRAEYINIIIYI